MGSEDPPASQEHPGKWETEESEAQRASAAPRAIKEELVPKASLEPQGKAESRVCLARMAATECRDWTARRGSPAPTVSRERRALTGCPACQGEQGPRVRRENRAVLESWVRQGPLESQASPEMPAHLGSEARQATGAPRGLWAHKALLGLLASEGSRAERAALATLGCQVPRAFEVVWVTRAREEPLDPRESRALRDPMASPGTEGSWVPAAPLDPKESLAVGGSLAPKAPKAPTVPVVWTASPGPPDHWACLVPLACLASQGERAFRAKRPASSTSGSCVGAWSANKLHSWLLT